MKTVEEKLLEVFCRISTSSVPLRHRSPAHKSIETHKSRGREPSVYRLSTLYFRLSNRLTDECPHCI